jgi:16S rRNA (cytosine967-C5)-methyltransferase
VAGVSPARACAFTVIRRVFEQGAYADRALVGEAAGLEPRDRALATRLAYGTVQRCATLDHVARALTGREPEALDPPILAALRLGLFQILLLSGVADHAAVNESVELAKRAHGGGFKLVNAVLRRATREGQEILDALDDETPERAAILHSVPEWLARLWWAELGAEQARLLLAAVNEPAESSLRVNRLIATPEAVVAALPVSAHRASHVPEGLILEGPFDAHGSELWASGAIMPQSRASMLVARMLAPEARERVLDLCAAPGAKTTHLAALMGGAGEVVAVERVPGRADALRRTCTRMHAGCVRVETGDARLGRADGPFDRVLVDPPCSGLGTLQSRPDIRWRGSPRDIATLSEIQARLLAAGAAATATGGVLVYSVCTITRAESTVVLGEFLSGHPEFVVERSQQLMPHRDGTDGFFIARLHRTGPARGTAPGRAMASGRSTTLGTTP